MKNAIILFIGLLLVNFSFPEDIKKDIRIKPAEIDSITLLSSPDLYNLTEAWADEFCRLNPDVKIGVIKITGTNGDKKADITKNLGFISNEFAEMFEGSTWNIVVGRDVIVPVFNTKNPFVNEIYRQGISPENLSRIFKDEGLKSWGTLLDNRDNTPVNIYMIEDKSIDRGLAEFLKVDHTSFNCIRAADGQELISLVQKDPFSIGICKLTNIPDVNVNNTSEVIQLLPLDRNGNGKIDYMEEIYDDLNILSRGVWIGKYPSQLFKNLYSVSSEKPKNKTEVAFLNWVLTDGQQILNNYGYSDLLLTERQSKIDFLNNSEPNLITSNENNGASKSFLIILGSLALITLLGLSMKWYLSKREVASQINIADSHEIFDEEFIDVPLGLYYDKTHTWAYMEKDGTVRIGIDDFLQHITGPLTRVKMKETGEKIRKGKPVLSIIQEGKQLNIYAPISGTIKEINKVLDTNSSIINSSPYSEGWVYRIEPTNWLKEIQFLIMAKKYKEWLQGEFSRLKEFLSTSLNPKTIAYTNVLQDGGALKDGILKELGPEVWEDFQTNFIDI